MCTVSVRSSSTTIRAQAVLGETVLSLLQRTEGPSVDAPCGGNGTCGKCRVEIEGAVSRPDAAERSLLGPRFSHERTRLACRVRIEGDCSISLLQEASISDQRREKAFAGGVAPDPIVRIAHVALEPASLPDQRDSTARLAAAFAVPESFVGLAARATLGKGVPGDPLRIVRSERRIIDLRSDVDRSVFGIAADIGTSTVVLHLIDLSTGAVVGSAAASNAQRSFGADVISRISYASKSEANLDLLREKIVRQIDAMTGDLVRSHGGGPEDVVLVMAAGNTTMLHLLAGISPKRIAEAPFIPVFTDSLVVEARAIGLHFNPNAELRFLPSVAAYVGSDIVAGIVATGLDRASGPVLLVDLGTNCEVVLGDRDRIVACAAAAGPAFEGAQIECGVSGIGGAIRRVWFADRLQLETIGGGRAIGICGSGVLDTTALLLERGIVDETGRMRAPDEALAFAEPLLAGRLAPSDGHGRPLRFLLSDRETMVDRNGAAEAQKRSAVQDAESSQAVYFTQKDVREVQLAKAAIAAGIDVLAARLGISVDAIERVHLSGAFGSSMSAQSACTIGMLPQALRGRAEGAGNTSGRGVVAAIGSLAALRRCEQAHRRVEYVELSSDSQFRDAYVEHMTFPPPGFGKSPVRTGGGRQPKEAR